MGIDYDNVPQGRQDKVRLDSKIEVYKFPEKKWIAMRLVGSLQPHAGYWVQTKTKEGKVTRFFIEAPSYNYETLTRDDDRYDPWRDFEAAEFSTRDRSSKEQAVVQFSTSYWTDAIIRSLQDKAPAKMPRLTKNEQKTGIKDKESDSWTPEKAVRLTAGLARKIKELKALNTVTSKKTGNIATYHVNHEKFGRDIMVYYDSSKAAAEQYQVQVGERTPLTEEELEYLHQDLAVFSSTEFDDSTVKADFESWAKRNGHMLDKSSKKGKKVVDEDDDEDEDLDDDDDEDDAPAPRKKKPASKKRPAEDDEDADDDPPPRKKGKKVVDDEDEDDLDDDEDDDEDDAPPPPKKKASKKVVDDDDDEDDEPAPKKRPAKKAAKKVVDDDDEFGDDDDLDEDDDEDDEPAPKKSSKKRAPPVDEDDEDEEDDEPAPKKRPAKKAAKKVVDDDDDFDDEDDDTPPPPKKKGKKVVDEDEDEDEDDEPPPRASKKSPAKKAAKKRPVDDEDDDEDF